MAEARVILTRTDAENLRTAAAFADVGLATTALPMIEIIDLDPILPTAPDDLLSGPISVLLTSHRGAERWLLFREGRGADLSIKCYYLVGQRAETMLRREDPDVPIAVTGASISDLQENIIARFPNGDSGCVLYPCSRLRRQEAVDGFRAMGLDLIELPLYEPITPPDAAEQARQILATLEPGTAITFFSPSAVDNLLSVTTPASLAPHHLVAIGATTAETLYRHGLESSVHIPHHPTLDALISTTQNLLTP